MKLSLLTWNAVNINDGNPFKAAIRPGQLSVVSKSPVVVNRSLDEPFLSTVVRNSSSLIIQVLVASGQNVNTNRELVKRYFFGDDNRHDIVAQDENDSNKQYYRTGIPISINQESEKAPNSFFITIATEHQYWQLVTPTSDSWDITASGDSDVIANGGNIPVPPILTITPTTTKTAGLKYRRYIPIYNNMDKSLNVPLEITNGGLDVQTLINAGKMQADGDDFRVWQDGVFADRWLYGVDSDSDPGKCWVNYDMPARHEAITSATFDSDDTTISFSQTRKSLSFLRSLKLLPNKTLLIDNEALVYSDSDIDFINYRIANVSRSQKDTAAVSHASSSTVRHIPHDTWILYGDSDLGAQDVDSDFEPIFDLSSTNNAWSYTYYFDLEVERPGSWKPEIEATKTHLSYTFTGNENTFANPSTKLGLAMINGGDFQVQNEAGILSWLFSHPCGVTQIAYTGEVYNTGSWPAIVGLQYRLPNTVWQTAVDETEPTVTLTWEAFGTHTVVLGGTYESIRHAIDGQLDSVLNEKAMVQFDTHSITFDSDNLPTIAVNAEASINFFDFILTNATTGEFIKVQSPCPINTSLIIDCANKKAYLEDGTPVRVTLSTDREAWFNLAVGNNSLNYVDVGTVAVNIVISHRDRIL